MTVRSQFRHIALAGIVLTMVACSEPTQPIAPAQLVSGSRDVASAAGGGTTLFFNGVNANASTPLGSVLTTQIDNIAYEATVRYDGPNAAGNHEMIFYNGHGGVSGWGIIVLGTLHGFPNGSLGILAGGIDVPMTPFVLIPGWHHIYAERCNQQVTVVFDGESYSIGGLGVHPVGGVFAGIERTSVGGDGTFDAPTGDFNGAIDNVRVIDLNTDTWVERWNFNAGQGTTAVGKSGTVLQLGNAVWARRGNP